MEQILSSRACVGCEVLSLGTATCVALDRHSTKARKEKPGQRREPLPGQAFGTHEEGTLFHRPLRSASGCPASFARTACPWHRRRVGRAGRKGGPARITLRPREQWGVVHCGRPQGTDHPATLLPRQQHRKRRQGRRHVFVMRLRGRALDRPNRYRPAPVFQPQIDHSNLLQVATLCRRRTDSRARRLAPAEQ